MFQASLYVNTLKAIENYFACSSDRMPVTGCLNPVDLAQAIDVSLPIEGESLETLHQHVSAYLQSAVKTAHPGYFNQLWGGFQPASFMGEMLATAANTSMYTLEVAPVATAIERTLIAKFGQLVGFESPDGQFTTGGSNGNLMAMAIALHRAFPNAKVQGCGNHPSAVAFVSEDAHYSFAKAAHLLGIGTQHLWKIPVDRCGSMNVRELERSIEQATDRGFHPFFVAATAGTTVRGAYDPLSDIASVTSAHGIWLHVDGAWGASVLLSRTHNPLMAGVEAADSVVWDAHKMMGMPLTCSVLLVKHRGSMLDTFATDGTGYIFHGDRFHEGSDDLEDLGPSSMHCGRRADALKLWLAWKHLGDRGWERQIDRYFHLAAYAELLVQEHPQLQLVAPRQSLNLCFQYCPQTELDPSTLVPQIRQILLEEGTAMVNYARLGDRVAFRLVICNNQTTEADIAHLLDEIVAIGRRLESKLKAPAAG
ncbi:MAG: aminotransferase class V-fold PLP-dependent enzyme [Cyanobacteria bacterium P01_E01_bin.45]